MHVERGTTVSAIAQIRPNAHPSECKVSKADTELCTLSKARSHSAQVIVGIAFGEW